MRPFQAIQSVGHAGTDAEGRAPKLQSRACMIAQVRSTLPVLELCST